MLLPLIALLLPYSATVIHAATIDSAASEISEDDGYAAQSLHLPYRHEANRYRDDVQAAPSLTNSRNEMHLRQIATEAGRLIHARLPKIRYAGVKNTGSPSDEGLAQLLREYEQLRDEVSRLERTLSPADKQRRRLVLDSSPPPPATTTTTTSAPLTEPPAPVAPLLQPLSSSKLVKRRKLRKNHRRLAELPLLSDPSLIEALQKGQVFILKENRLQPIDATQSAALSEELRRGRAEEPPATLPRPTPLAPTLPLEPLPSPTTTTTTTTTTAPTTQTPTTTTTTVLPPLNDQERVFLSQLKALFPNDASLDAKFNEYRQRMAATTTTAPPPQPSPPSPSPPPFTQSPSNPPALPIRSFIFVPGTNSAKSTSPPISPLFSFSSSSEPLPLREIASNEITPQNRPHAASQPLAVPETFGRRAGALFVNGKGDIVDGKGNPLTAPASAAAALPQPERPTLAQLQHEQRAQRLQALQAERAQLLEQQAQLQAQQLEAATPQPPTTVQPTQQPAAATTSQLPPAAEEEESQAALRAQYYRQYQLALLQRMQQMQQVINAAAAASQPAAPAAPPTAAVPVTGTVAPAQPRQTFLITRAATPTEAATTVRPTASTVNLADFTSKPLPTTTVAQSPTVPSTTPHPALPQYPQYPQYPAYPSPYHPFYPPPPPQQQQSREAPVFERYSTWEIPAGTDPATLLQGNLTGNASSLPQALLIVDPTKKANDPPTILQLPPNYPAYPPQQHQSPNGYYPPYPPYPYPPYPYPSPYGGSPYGGGWPGYPPPASSTPHPLSKLFSQNAPDTPLSEEEEKNSAAPSSPSAPSPSSRPSPSSPQVISPQEAAAILAQFYSNSPKKH